MSIAAITSSAPGSTTLAEPKAAAIPLSGSAKGVAPDTVTISAAGHQATAAGDVDRDGDSH
jgi:hypothetical protein